MKRRTNLFYNADSNDSKFITFSNYAESLTGNFLATDTKIFPSTFICTYIPSLTPETKDDFVKNYLCAKYENKLAYLRDYFLDNDVNPEDMMDPLKYLWETIIEFDSSSAAVLVDNITEEDYNGTFTDTICVVDGSNYSYGVWNSSSTAIDYVEYTDPTTYLYGWCNNISYEYTGPSNYADVAPKFDQDTKYATNSNLSSMTLYKGSDDIAFNAVIVLYDVFNEVSDSLSFNPEVEQEMDNNISSDYLKNVPLGIWFSGADPVVLKHDDAYAPTWSLVIGSQFKPFPYSKLTPSEITKTSKADAYRTFAQVLTRQNRLFDKFEQLYAQIASLSDRLNVLESKVADMGTVENIDEIKLDISKMKTDFETEIEELKRSTGHDLVWIEK